MHSSLSGRETDLQSTRGQTLKMLNCPGKMLTSANIKAKVVTIISQVTASTGAVTKMSLQTGQMRVTKGSGLLTHSMKHIEVIGMTDEGKMKRSGMLIAVTEAVTGMIVMSGIIANGSMIHAGRMEMSEVVSSIVEMSIGKITIGIW